MRAARPPLGALIMTDEAAEIARLTDAQRAVMISIHGGFGVGDLFRPDEGDSHAVFTALHKLGLLGRERLGDMPMAYWLTDAGFDARAALLQRRDDDDICACAHYRSEHFESGPCTHNDEHNAPGCQSFRLACSAGDMREAEAEWMDYRCQRGDGDA